MRKILMGIFCLCLLTSCQKKDVQTSGLLPEASIQTDSKLYRDAQTFVDELKLDESLKPLKDRNVKGLIFSGEKIYDDAAMLVASDNSADMVGIFAVEDIAEAKSRIQNYVDSLKSQYTIYSSSERFKLTNAIIEDNGKDLVVLIVCSDVEEAKTAVKNYLAR